MYQVGHRQAHRYWLFVLAAIIIIPAGVAGWLIVRNLQANTILSQAPEVTRLVTADESATQHVVKGVVNLDLPVGWQPLTLPDVKGTVYSWRGSEGTKDAARRIDIYIDSAPGGLAVNRLLPVTVVSDHLTVTGDTSANCTTFTDRSAASVRTGVAPAAWDGVDFLCDMGNYERDVVAIGSPEAVNTVTLSGLRSGRHRVLLVYTDNSANPDYTLFAAAVTSFRLM